MWGGEIQQHGL